MVGRWLRFAVVLTTAGSLCACAGDTAETSPRTGLRVEAQRSVLITEEPLGDVVSGELNAGDEATAVCFVSGAQTNTGLRGTAVQVEAGRDSGFVATTDFPADVSNRSMTFDIGEAELRDRLPRCAG